MGRNEQQMSDMEDLKVPEELHLEGEEGFVFPTAGGKVRLSVTQDTFTPHGGLVPWAPSHLRPTTLASGNAVRGFVQPLPCVEIIHRRPLG